MTSVCAAMALALATVMAQSPAFAGAGGRIGVLGDSYSDEYQFYRPHRETARNWVEILATARGVDFGEFRASSWGEPRNEGFEHNWARSGATTSVLLAQKQHLGLAEQVAQGQVSIAVVFAGGNDFIEALHASEPVSVLDGLGARAFANIKIAVDTLLAAHPDVKLLIATVPDVRDLPEFRDAIRQGELDSKTAARAAAEIDLFNAEIRKLPIIEKRVGVFDFAHISRVSLLISPKHVVVAGRKVERERTGNSPDRLFLGDVRHLGTMGQGMIAKMMIDALNKKCGAAIKPLDESEIVSLSDSLANGGLATANSDVDRTGGQ